MSIARPFLALVLALLSLLPPAANAAAPKRVMVLQSFGRDFAPFDSVGSTFRSELARIMPVPVLFQEASLEAERIGPPEDERLLVEFLRTRYAAMPPDLVVALGGPAMRFYLRQRQVLFPGCPLLIAGVDQRVAREVPLAAHDRMVSFALDLPRVAHNVLQVLPQTSTLAVVVGSSAFERFWLKELQTDLKPLEDRVKLLWLTDVSLEQLRRRVASLPSNSAVFYGVFATDADGVPQENERALALVRAASSAPVFGVFEEQLGSGIVGGPLIGLRAAGIAAARSAQRMLEHADTTADKVQVIPIDFTAFDWRELERWDIPEARLPKGSDIRFKAPSLWQQHKFPIVAAALALIAQAFLIVTLVIQRRRRRLAELEVQRQRTELAHASRLTTLGELSASIAHEVNQPLGAISGNADAVALLLEADPPRLDDAKRVLLDLKNANQRASDVVRRIRELLRKRELEIESYDLNGAASDVIRLLDGETAQRHVEVVTEFGLLPTIQGDRLQFQQVLLNLMMNGLDAMADTHVNGRRLTVRTTHHGDDEAEIMVIDTGRGLPEGDSERLFDSFFTTRKEGMGLGLTLCRSIVQAHGGRIWAQNNPGGGASFRFTLPIVVNRAHSP